MTEPMNALALATVPPASNSQSTMKPLRTKTLPMSICHRCTDGMFVVVAAAARIVVLVVMA